MAGLVPAIHVFLVVRLLRGGCPAQACTGPAEGRTRLAGHDGGIWLVSFSHYDLGYFDLEQKTLQPLDNPFGPRLSPMS
jgi:hypothetical protein